MTAGGLYRHINADLRADCRLSDLVHFIRRILLVRLCHEARLLLQNPLPVHFDHLPGCRCLTGRQQEGLGREDVERMKRLSNNAYVITVIDH